MKLNKFIPIVNIESKKTWFWTFDNGHLFSELDIIIIRLEELKRSNKLLEEVIKAGGLHSHTNFDGKIILSAVMRDSILDKFSPAEYADLIRKLKPDAATGFDGYTYSDDSYAINNWQINKVLNQNKELISHNLNCELIGLVKGATLPQIKRCTQELLGMGYKMLAFPCGDFTKKPTKESILKVREFAYEIKKHSGNVMLIGFASPYKFDEFSFVDSFAALNWKVNAQKGGAIFTEAGSKKFQGIRLEEAFTKNLLFICKKIENLKFQKKIIGGNVGWA